MSDNERIIENINATMSMEDMPLMEADKERIRKCLEGKVSFQTEVEFLIKKYMRKQVNITDTEELKQAEREITSLRAAQLMVEPLTGEFDFEYLKRLHLFLFGDIYEWAGKIRKVNISKGNQFCLYQYIEDQMNDVLSQLRHENYLEGLNLKVISKRLAYYLGEINAVHPFREGNGRTQRAFIAELAAHNGYKLDWLKISKEEMLEASLQTFNREYKLMEDLMIRALTM